MMYLLLLCVAFAAAAPSSKQLSIDSKYFADSYIMYSGSHDIVEITVPLNDLNYPDDEEVGYDHLRYVFFVEADLKEDGTKAYQGVYVFKNGKAKKILDHGQTVTYAKDNMVYVGASDGVWWYSYKDDTLEKCGSVTHNVIKMRIDTENVAVYYLTSDYVLYKFDKSIDESTKVEAVKDARDFVFDFEGNLYFYDGSKKFYVYNGSKVVEIEGLPAATKVTLVNPPIFIDEVYVVLDGSVYKITPEGKSVSEGVKLDVPVTAFAPDTVLIEFFAYNKKIYEYNLISLIEKSEDEDFKEFFNNKEDELKNLSKTKPKKKV